jgi:hypothetical protein
MQTIGSSALSNLSAARHLADLGQQQHISSTTAFEQWFIHQWDLSTVAGCVDLIACILKPVCAALVGALQLLAAVEPSALLQQVRP